MQIRTHTNTCTSASTHTCKSAHTHTHTRSVTILVWAKYFCFFPTRLIQMSVAASLAERQNAKLCPGQKPSLTLPHLSIQKCFCSFSFDTTSEKQATSGGNGEIAPKPTPNPNLSRGVELAATTKCVKAHTKMVKIGFIIFVIPKMPCCTHREATTFVCIAPQPSMKIANHI